MLSEMLINIFAIYIFEFIYEKKTDLHYTQTHNDFFFFQI